MLYTCVSVNNGNTFFSGKLHLQATIMAMPLDKLKKYFVIDKLVYHSVDLSLYMASAVIDGEEHYITDNKGQFLKSRNLVELQKLLQTVKADETVLRHTSPYDEMIGGPEKGTTNALEVPLVDNKLY